MTATRYKYQCQHGQTCVCVCVVSIGMKVNIRCELASVEPSMCHVFGSYDYDLCVWCVCVQCSQTKPSWLPLIRPDRCYYIEMSAVMYASVMWTCPLLLDGTWRFSLLWHVWKKKAEPSTNTLAWSAAHKVSWSLMKPHEHTSWRHWHKVTRCILPFSQSANKSDVSPI